jgi:hypothetical protein
VLRPVVVLSSLVLMVSAGSACKKRSAALAADAAGPPSFTRPAAVDAAFEIDALWSRASGADPIDLATLADREGARGLLAGVEAGGEPGVTALHALPYADDAELGLRRLAEIGLQTDGDTQRDVVDTVLRIAIRPAPDEPLDPEGVRSCGAALLDIARRGSVDRDTRALAVSALRLLAERQAVDPAQIPTDLDAP